MRWNFPEIKTTRNIEERLRKILDEVDEFSKASFKDQDMEAIDILHAVETFLRGKFKGREKELDALIKQVYDKNSKREYYTKECF